MVLTNKIVNQAIELGFSFDEDIKSTDTIKDLSKLIWEYFEINKRLLPQLEQECVVYRDDLTQYASFKGQVISGDIIDFSKYETEAPTTKIYHTTFVGIDSDGGVVLYKLYTRNKETPHNAPEGYYWDVEFKRHLKIY